VPEVMIDKNKTGRKYFNRRSVGVKINVIELGFNKWFLTREPEFEYINRK
jgi:hypothetical protein